MWVKLDRAVNAVKTVVPQEMWGAIAEKLEQAERDPPALNGRAGEFSDGTDPDELADVADERETASPVDEQAERRHEAYWARVDARRGRTRPTEIPSPAIRDFTPQTVNDEDEDDF